MSDEKKRRVALVTGASKGIGRGIAHALADAGWDIAINYRSDLDGAEETAEQVRKRDRTAWVIAADVGKASEVSSMFSQLDTQAGRIDLLVNNAGVQTWGLGSRTVRGGLESYDRYESKGRFLVYASSSSPDESPGGWRRCDQHWLRSQ